MDGGIPSRTVEKVEWKDTEQDVGEIGWRIPTKMVKEIGWRHN